MTTLKMAVVAPIPTARMRIAMAVNAGFARSMRSVWRTSWRTSSKIAVCMGGARVSKPRFDNWLGTEV